MISLSRPLRSILLPLSTAGQARYPATYQLQGTFRCLREGFDICTWRARIARRQVRAPGRAGLSDRCAHLDAAFAHRDLVAGAHLASASQVDLAVDAHAALLDQRLGVATAAGQAGGLQQRVQRDVLAAQ